MRQFVCFFVMLIFSTNVFAERIEMMSGEVFEAEISMKNETYVYLSDGLKYFIKSIRSIDNQVVEENQGVKDVPFKTLMIIYDIEEKDFTKNPEGEEFKFQKKVYIDVLKNRKREEYIGEYSNSKLYPRISVYDYNDPVYTGDNPMDGISFGENNKPLWADESHVSLFFECAKDGEEIILGKTCEAYSCLIPGIENYDGLESVEPMKECVWNHLLLSSEMKSDHFSRIQRVVDIQENIDFSEDLFESHNQKAP